MIIYTSFQIVDLIIDATCQRDIKEVCDYINENKRKYSLNHLKGFQDIINNKNKKSFN